MIGHLRGTLLRKTLPAVIVEAAGVGYEVRLSLNTFEALPAEGAEARLLVLTLFRNEALELYGFATPEEKAAFTALLGVSGVGPKIALSLLSALRVGELVQALRSERSQALEKVPGIGRKTAQRLVLELKDKLKDLPAAAGEPQAAPVASDLAADAVAALENLGYGRADAEAAVAQAQAGVPDAQLGLLLREALRRLGSRR